jgi:ring-1,2-phenylacetyl-CoA epoxidase subunit PaaD
VTIARQFIVSYYQFELYRRLTESTDATLAAIAAKAVKEVDYHRDHSAQWVLRLAGGTDESRRSMIHGLQALMWPYVEELFQDDDLTPAWLRREPPSRLPACVRTLTASPANPHRSRAGGAGRPGSPRAAAGAASTPSTWATSSPRCRCWPASIPERAGDTACTSPTLKPGPGLREQKAWDIAATVCDPEIPVLTIEDLGILRERGGHRVTTAAPQVPPSRSPSRPRTRAARRWTPSATTSNGLRQGGLPERAGGPGARPGLDHGLDDRAGKAKLQEYGIAPPSGMAAAGHAGPVRLSLAVKCPQCSSLNTKELTRFGSTSCKALYVCQDCKEPFDYFKVL